MLPSRKGAAILYTSFEGNETGWKAEDMSFDSALLGGRIANNITGIAFDAESNSSPVLSISEANILDNTDVGVLVDGKSTANPLLRVMCGRVNGSSIGIHVANNAALDMSGKTYGRVNLSGNGITIKATMARSLALVNGRNDLEPAVIVPGSIIQGQLNTPITTILAPGNRWNAAGSAPGATDISLLNSANLPVTVDVQGSTLSEIPTLCLTEAGDNDGKTLFMPALMNSGPGDR